MRIFLQSASLRRHVVPAVMGICLLWACGPETPASYTQSAPDRSVNPRPALDMGADVPPKPITGTDSGFTAGDPCNAWADIPDQRLLAELHNELHNDYNPIAAQPDLGGNPNRYTTARRIMFTEVERYQARDGSYVVECVYTGNTATAPRTDDPDRDFINCEHVLPRARMANEEGQPIVYSHQQSDIHNLMPTTPGSNSTRGSLRYGDVVNERNLDHLPSMSGENASGDLVWQPRAERRGDVARITFYMAARWGIEIPGTEEDVLRRWNRLDPPDDRERLRNERIEGHQGNRNPFIDCSSLVDRIDDFISFAANDRENTLPAP